MKFSSLGPLKYGNRTTWQDTLSLMCVNIKASLTPAINQIISLLTPNPSY